MLKRQLLDDDDDGCCLRCYQKWKLLIKGREAPTGEGKVLTTALVSFLLSIRCYHHHYHHAEVSEFDKGRFQKTTGLSGKIPTLNL